MWMALSYVKITHKPTGIEVKIESDRQGGLRRARKLGLDLLRSKLASNLYGPHSLVRSYEIPDGQLTTEQLEYGSSIGIEIMNRRYITRSELLAKAASMLNSSDFPPLTELCKTILTMAPIEDREDEISEMAEEISKLRRNESAHLTEIARLKREMSLMVPTRNKDKLNPDAARIKRNNYMRKYRKTKGATSPEVAKLVAGIKDDESNTDTT
jgi:hypothetical protein